MKVAALDVGGTYIKSAMVEEGQCRDFRETPTHAGLGGMAVVENMARILSSYPGAERIGVSTAGQVDPATGSILYAGPTMPGYTGVAVRRILTERFGVPVCVERDVDAVSIGEGVYGAARGEADYLCLTYGTGVGGSCVIGGSLLKGAGFSAAAFGAIITHADERRPEDPFSGCYERYASTAALVRDAMAYDRELTDGRKIFERIGDPSVSGIVHQWIGEIVTGLISVTVAFNPPLILLGGGIMQQSYVFESVKAQLLRELPQPFQCVRLRQAAKGNKAGLLGAAHLASRR